MIELVKPEFQVGSEKRFFDFISGLNEKDKIALISHTDLDGIASAKVANEVLNAGFLKFVNYIELKQGLVEELKAGKVTKVIITDISVGDYFLEIEKISKFAEVLIIDHHVFSRDFNSEKVIFLNAQGYCATYLCYYLFGRVQDITGLDWLVASACIADYCFRKNIHWLTEIYKKYGDELEMDGTYVRKSGKIWDLQYDLSLALIYFKDDLKKVYGEIGREFEDIGDLKKYADEIDSCLKESLDKFEKEKEEINGRIFWEFNPKFKVGSIVSTITSSQNPNKTHIIAREDGEFYSFSARRQDKKEDMNLLLKKLIVGLENAEGGGHIPAAGGHVLLKDWEEFKKRLRELPKEE